VEDDVLDQAAPLLPPLLPPLPRPLDAGNQVEDVGEEGLERCELADDVAQLEALELVLALAPLLMEDMVMLLDQGLLLDDLPVKSQGPGLGGGDALLGAGLANLKGQQTDLTDFLAI
jgi:hypothetical protein